ncbi:hypothetical protein [Thermococcus sp.]|uniref:hypothetical protein n=1 Tax=Thermococcus sp. TaxID=35749 RepID=UPI00260B77F7|nr:hypothetical protein [Thermococcus sp.]
MYEKLKLISEIVSIRERIAEFERKYGMPPEEFEKKLRESEESFPEKAEGDLECPES